MQLYYSEETSRTIQAKLDQAGTYAVGIGPAKDAVDASLVAAAHARSLAVHPYTVNERPDMQRLAALGVDGIFTNFPDRLDEVTRRRLAKPPLSQVPEDLVDMPGAPLVERRPGHQRPSLDRHHPGKLE